MAGREKHAGRLEAFEAECRRRGLALTIQRRAVFAELAERRDHPTADDVYETLRERLPGLSRTTVYRVLDTLVEQGFACKVQHAGSGVRYDGMTERHHHLVCDRCERLVDLDDAVVPELALPAAQQTGFRVRDYSVHFKGLCKSCR